MPKKLKASFIALLLIIALPFGLFNKTLSGKYVFVSGDFSGSDLLDLHLPFKYSLNSYIPQGKLPLWEPDLALGFPILAEGQSGPFYPPNML